MTRGALSKEELKKEQQQLDSMLKIMGTESKRLKEKAEEIYEDLDWEMSLGAQKNDGSARANELRKQQTKMSTMARAFETIYPPNPYFRRIDVVEKSGEITSYYFRQGTTDDEHQKKVPTDIIIYQNEKNEYCLVYDWRNKINTAYTAGKNSVAGGTVETAFNYELNNSTVEWVSYERQQEQETSAVSDSDHLAPSADPFLQKILEQKDREGELTDIIRTITSDQIKIVSLPKGADFAVQGIAGSGKTEIMLHRLSWLAYNEPSMEWERVKIITPNKYFQSHIYPICKDLGINHIAQRSVEEYYTELLSDLSRKDTDNLAEMQKSDRCYKPNSSLGGSVREERSLNKELLLDLYSEKTVSEFTAFYKDYWKSILKQIDFSRLANVGDRKPLFESLEKIEYTWASYNKMHSYILEAQSVIHNRKAAKEKIEEELAILQNGKLLERARNERVRSQTRVLDYFTRERQEVERAIEDASQKLNNARKDREALEREIEKTEQEITKAVSQGADYLDIEKCLKKTDAMAQRIKERARTEITTYQEQKMQAAKLPEYNFVEKQRLANEIETIKVRFSEIAKNEFAGYDAHTYASVGELQKKRNQQAEMVEEKKEEENNILAEKASLAKNKEYIAQVISMFSQKELPGLGTDLLKARPPKKYEEIISEYKEKCNAYYDVKKETDNKIKECRERLETAKSACVDDETEMYVSSCADVVASLKVLPLTKGVVEKFLRTKYEKFGQQYAKDKIYRHKLFYQLLCWGGYYRNLGMRDALLNIDEAQDLSKSECVFLRQLLKGCTFNVYGDVNQKIYSFKGINDWKSDFGVDECYTLKADYRNTAQIVEYCNKSFNTDIVSVGKRGDEVSELSLEAAVDKILRMKEANPDISVAIIRKYGFESVDEEVRKALKKFGVANEVAWHIVDKSKKVSVISTEAAKGLEFNAVVVVDDAMDVGEKFVAYTRARNDLIVVKEKFPLYFQEEEDIK